MSNYVLGGQKRGAARLGISLAEYQRRIDAGESWCWACRSWKDTGQFYRRRKIQQDPSGQCVDCHRDYMRAYMRRRYAAAEPAAERAEGG
jgi:hypothetical protein